MEPINMESWITFEQLTKSHPLYCRDSRNARELIRQKNLTTDQWIWCRHVENQWLRSSGASRKLDHALFSKQFINGVSVM